jgi:hypothetical protein
MQGSSLKIEWRISGKKQIINTKKPEASLN